MEKPGLQVCLVNITNEFWYAMFTQALSELGWMQVSKGEPCDMVITFGATENIAPIQEAVKFCTNPVGVVVIQFLYDPQIMRAFFKTHCVWDFVPQPVDVHTLKVALCTASKEMYKQTIL